MRVRVAVWRHALLSVVTGGVWLVVWGALLMGKCLRPWRCAVCGWHKAEFRPECGAGVRKKTAAPEDRGDGGKKVQPPTVE